MRKKLMLRLCLVLAVALTAYSCRTDQFHEKETYSNSSKFQLTSKRISLNEAKHKDLLLPEIEKAESAFQSLSKKNVNGKVVDYGSGVSIDTDDVIYIENGANYHTYTFNIKRQNAPEDAPLENLLLSPLPDGTYQEFLITYNLTAQEREKIRNGEPVNTKGKTTIAELAKGTFNSGGQLAKMSCNWTEQTIYVTCSDNVHNASNVEQWHQCKAATPPGVYTIVTGGCITEQPEYIDPGNSGGGSSDGGGGPGGDGSNECTTVANNPGEVGIIDENGCNVGGVTQPNDPPVKGNPCEKVKNITDNTTGLKNKIQTLNTPANLALNYERGAIVADNAQGESVVTSVDGNPGETLINVLTPPTGEQTAFIHTHFEGSTMLPIFSFEDLGVFDAIHFRRFTNNKPLDKLTIMVISKAGVYALLVDNSTRFYNAGGEMMTNRDNLYKQYYGKLPQLVNVTYNDIIKQVVSVLPEFGLSLYKATDDQLNGWNKMVYDPATDTVNEIPCN
ncbi:hypothetical protein [Chryseobacterium sp. RLHN22]|uniref:hypothetical protein n=1 Tax=Chryseobacterium sp. RLHN22 TaxID=3437885 RepID=UPI003D9BA6F3